MKRVDEYESNAMIKIRRVFTHVEQIQHEFGPVAKVPLLRGAIGAVLTNPFAGRYVPDILPMMDALQSVGTDMAERLRAAICPTVLRPARRSACVNTASRLSASMGSGLTARPSAPQAIRASSW